MNFKERILANTNLSLETPKYNQIADTDEGLFLTQDNEGMSYVFRGASRNNYVKFAGAYWRIIRINGDSSIRVIYDGTVGHDIGEESEDRMIGVSAYNDQGHIPVTDRRSIGFMYGTDDTAANAYSNLNNSTVKALLEQWYEDNLLPYADCISKQSGFWNDRQFTIETTGEWTFKGHDRIEGFLPSLKCDVDDDWFTMVGASAGNKMLKYPIGLITADEIMMAGEISDMINRNPKCYLYTGSDCWSMTPDIFDTEARAFTFRNYIRNQSTNDGYNGIRPVINILPNVEVSGLGTKVNPYEVKGLIELNNIIERVRLKESETAFNDYDIGVKSNYITMENGASLDNEVDDISNQVAQIGLIIDTKVKELTYLLENLDQDWADKLKNFYTKPETDEILGLPITLIPRFAIHNYDGYSPFVLNHKENKFTNGNRNLSGTSAKSVLIFSDDADYENLKIKWTVNTSTAHKFTLKFTPYGFNTPVTTICDAESGNKSGEIVLPTVGHYDELSMYYEKDTTPEGGTDTVTVTLESNGREIPMKDYVADTKDYVDDMFRIVMNNKY